MNGRVVAGVGIGMVAAVLLALAAGGGQTPAPAKPAAAQINLRARVKTRTTCSSPTIKPLLPRGAAADIPQIEIYLMKWTRDGHHWPLVMPEPVGFELVGVDGSFDCGYGGGASGVRLGIGTTDAGTCGRQLVAGAKYYVRGMPLAPQFVVPEVAKGQVARVELDVDDEREDGATTQAVAPAAVPSVGEISGSVQGLPVAIAGKDDGVIYHKGETHVFGRVGADGRFTIKGVPSLGGELAAVSMRQQLTCAYIGELKTRQVDLAKDADVILDPAKMVDFTIRYDLSRLPKGAAVLSLHLTKDGVLPMAWFVVDPKATLLHVKAPVGKWTLKAVVPASRGPELPVLGEITVTAGGEAWATPATQP